jgi:hypothetical protein
MYTNFLIKKKGAQDAPFFLKVFLTNIAPFA